MFYGFRRTALGTQLKLSTLRKWRQHFDFIPFYGTHISGPILSVEERMAPANGKGLRGGVCHFEVLNELTFTDLVSTRNQLKPNSFLSAIVNGFLLHMKG